MKALKTGITLLLLSLSGSWALTSCCDTEDGSFVPPITLGEKINGSWTLNSMTQIDETAQKEKDLTAAFGFSTFNIQLGVDANGAPAQFTVSGNAPALLPVSGNWSMENDFYNSDGSAPRILLTDGSDKGMALTVTSVPGAKPSLEFKLTRKQNGQAFVSYVYNLVSADAE